MSNSSYINFTYKSPHEDVESVIGHNPDGSVNIKYTLLALRDLLAHNISIVNKLLDKNIDITDINPLGYNIVSINVSNQITKENLLNENILIKQPNVLEEEELLDDIYLSDEEETNQNRFKLINNLVNTKDINILNNDNDNTESDTDSDDLIDDIKNTKSIVDKYLNIINEKDSESDISENEYLSEEENVILENDF